MSIISIVARGTIDDPTVTDPFAVDPEAPIVYAGSFNTATSQYWGGDDRPRWTETVDSGPVQEARQGERLWQTGDGRWVMTRPGPVAIQLTDDEVEQWFTDHGYTADDRDLYVRSGHR